jgi:hypothetical protein
LKWRIAFTVKFDDNREVDQSTIVKLVEIAGRKIGLCDWRPQKKGRFGRFVIEKIELLPLKDEKREIQMIQYTGEDAPADLMALVEA